MDGQVPLLVPFTVFSSSCTNLSQARLVFFPLKRAPSQVPKRYWWVTCKLPVRPPGTTTPVASRPYRAGIQRSMRPFDSIQANSLLRRLPPTSLWVVKTDRKTITRPLSGPGNQYQPGLGKQVSMEVLVWRHDTKSIQLHLVDFTSWPQISVMSWYC